MEPLWNRITGSPGRKSGGGIRSSFDVADPKTRFDLTKGACNKISGILEREDLKKSVVGESLVREISDLIEAFEEEQKYPTEKNICMTYFLKQDLLKGIGVKVKELSVSFFGPVSSLFRVLFDSDQESTFRESEMIVGSSMFLQSMTVYRLNRQAEEDFSQLLFVMASKMKSQANILVHWFEVLGLNGQDESSGHKEFPLFHLLLDYVHHEGKVGEYARTGLLYLVDVISTSEMLEEWILNSDLCTLMASGLGALYSQLNRGIKKLSSISMSSEGSPPIVSIAANESTASLVSASSSASSEECKAHMDNFIAYLRFWQDMLTYCKSEKLSRKLIGHFDVLFLRQLLYPSIACSGDREGGYSGPLLMSFRSILETLEHNCLSQLIVCYFLGINATDSIGDYSNLVGAQGTGGTEFLNNENGSVVLTLKDIIFSCLESAYAKLRLVGLQLLSTLIRKYYPYIVGTVISVVPKDEADVTTPLDSLSMREMAILQTMKTDIETSDPNINSYASDMEIRMVNNPFLLPNQKEGLTPEERERVERTANDLVVPLFRHEIRQDDKIMKKLYELLITFYANTTEVNLALTGVFIELGVQGWASLRSWLLTHNPTTVTNTLERNRDRRRSVARDNMAILKHTKVLRILQDLCDQYQHYTVTIDKFDEGFNAFQCNLKVCEELGEAMTVHSLPQDQQQFNHPSLTPSVTSNSEGDESEDDDSRSSIRTTLQRTVSRISGRRKSGRTSYPRSDDQSSPTQSKAQLIPPNPDTIKAIDIIQPAVPTEIPLTRLYGNIQILREFIKEVEALLHIRSWLIDIA
jgi:hypothetical protein